MAKGKNLNPADAFRKSLRKKELKKNKAGRTKARDFALVKKDTRDLEDDIEQLEAVAEPSPAEAKRLAELKSELETINKKKAEYVEEHPEQRRLVYRPRKPRGEEEKDEEQLVMPLKRNLFNKNGLPRHPERSIYYDAVMNPFGVAPPGRQYMERPLLPGEVDSDEEDSDDEDEDDVVMPQGPPPGETADDSDDEIPMPAGPPPGSEPEPELQTHSMPNPAISMLPPLPPGPPPSLASHPGMFMPMHPGSSLPPPPPGFPMPPQHGFPPPPHSGFFPPPPHGLPPPPAFPQFPPNFRPALQGLPPPPGFFPRRHQSTSSMQDPLSSIPHETFQAHQAGQPPAGHPSLPAKPTPQPNCLPSRPPADVEAATVYAAPQLRDLKKEATAFVPAQLKRKRAGAGADGTASKRVNAAPVEDDEAFSAATAPRPDLLSTLRDRFGPAPVPAPASVKEKPKVVKDKPKDDYDDFVESMSDILGSAKK